MGRKHAVFEVSWEVCNMVGGIHTVISTKARTAMERLGDDYVAIGPWLLSESGEDAPFDEEEGFEEFCESCRARDIPVRVGRWRIPGRPRTILVEISRLYEKKDDILAKLWEDYSVDSISGDWDYVEPVLFGYAAGMVIEQWWEEYLAPEGRGVVVHAHEWMTGSSLLYAKSNIPDAGTVFTTHATMLGRALSSFGKSPKEGLGEKTPDELAADQNVTAKHSIEGIAAREADVFTTVSRITADEAELLHARRPDPLLPNGIDLGVIDEMAGPTDRAEARQRLVLDASRFLGEDVSDAALLCVAGRYEFHNKGIDVLLDAVAKLNGEAGPRALLYVLVPAGASGLRSEVLERRDQPVESLDGPVGISTHHLFDEENDPVHVRCRELGLDNAAGSRVKVIQVPIYLGPGDSFLGLPYSAVARAMDLTCFPSYYEPWGYTPQESLAVGVPTVTSDYAGFGRWAREQGLGAESGITVLTRVGRTHEDVVDELADVLREFLTTRSGGQAMDGACETCRAAASHTAWSDLFAHYESAYASALEALEERSTESGRRARRARRPLSVPASRATTPRLTPFEVAAALPPALQGLRRLSRNYWWSWNPDVAALFEELAPATWQTCGHNPVALLQQAEPTALERKSEDADYLARVADAVARFEAYVEAEGTRLDLGDDVTREHPVAYFSAEFGIHESLPIYGGGLGILAGDHLKSASDLGLPLVGVGLFYRLGYMNQRLTEKGEQLEVDRENDPSLLPLEPVRNEDGSELELRIQLPARPLYLRAWRLQVGRVPLYLLDANTESNRPEDRDITRNLYGGDAEMRLLQEIVLGRGGARLLRRMALQPAAYHINEGHAAFLALERVSRLVRDEGLSFEAAREVVRGTTAFTTHTPVPAGHDRFDEDLMRRYFSDEDEWVGVPWDRFYGLGRDADGTFNMTWLALSFASRVNGVSKLHGEASRRLLAPYWPGLLEEEAPVSSITNGVHLPTWTHPHIVVAEGREDPKGLWEARTALKQVLVERARASLERSFLERNDSPLLLDQMLDGLNERALFIGFARRFAPYKRAHLLFQDVERLRALLDDEQRPLRIFIAGKAHPRDERGREILRDIANHARSPELAGKVVFLEDYDIGLARALVQGVDVWLNTPVRMQEASGTSGMKAAANGALNLSIGDGWWPEACDGRNGWMIGGERGWHHQEKQDLFDSAVLYRLLEEEVVPLYYDRDTAGIPQGWVERIAHDLATIPPVFDSDRMVSEYAESAYRPLARSARALHEDRRALPKRKAEEALRVRRGFPSIKVVDARLADLSTFQAGESISARLDVDMGALAPEDVWVELVLVRNAGDGPREVVSVPLEPAGDAAANGVVAFEGSHQIDGSGRYAHGLRIRARHEEYAGGPLKDLVFWV